MDRSALRQAYATLARPLVFGDEEQIRALALVERVAELRRLLWRAGLECKTIDRVIAEADETELRRLEFFFREDAA